MKYLIITMFMLYGCAGPTGPQGIPGQTGNTGITGNPGIPGGNCSVTTLSPSNVAPNGGSLITCPDGSSSVVLNGSPGTNGVNGTNGTVITPIQFCNGFVQSYPGTFAESGICISGVMYGVYSENGGFLAELPPGDYFSDGINSSCSFKLSLNCVVTN